jgi:nicotinamidase-related amidase
MMVERPGSTRVEAVLLFVLWFCHSTRESLGMSASSMASQAVRRHVGKLNADKTCLLLCDMQERFRPLVHHMETVIQTTRYMTGVASALSMPIVATQQYTKVFGETIPDCFGSPEELASVQPIFEKKRFSMLTDEVSARLSELGKDSYLIVGIEAHVCVQQTCLDLLEQGKDVHVIADGVSSQQPFDRQAALIRLQQAGAYLTTAQSAAFMLMQAADHPNFKTVSKLTVEHMKLPNAFNDELLKR